MPQSQVITFIIIAAMLLFVLATVIIAAFTLRLWLQAKLSGSSVLSCSVCAKLSCEPSEAVLVLLNSGTQLITGGLGAALCRRRGK